MSPWVFDDVLASDPFCGFITDMAVRGVTLGCAVIDANHRLYCPDAGVNRNQMAAFMSRLGTSLFPTTCANGQVMKWNGAQWACANDIAGGGGTGTVTSLTAGTGLQGSPNPITAAGSLNIAPAYQLPQGCSNGQVPKSNGSGGWTCAADTVGAGTVSSVATGAGLQGGPITGTGTIDLRLNAAGGLAKSLGAGANELGLADGGVTTPKLADGSVSMPKIAAGAVGFSQIADGSVGSAKVISSQVQLRIAAICPRGQPMIGVYIDGTPICDNPVRTLPYATYRVSVAVRADGRPLLARDGGNLYDCADTNCTSGSDVNLNIGNDVAMALRSDGRAVVTAGNSFNQILVICGDAACTPGGRVQRTLDAGSIGTFSGIALRADNTPVVTYFDFGSAQTRLYVCGDPTCASGTVRNLATNVTPSGVRIRPNGTPVVALRDYFGGGHALYDCNDAACSSGTVRGLGGGESIRFLLGLATRSDNRPLVINSGPVLHDCADAACTSNTPRPFDAGETVTASAVAMRADGRPLLVYGTPYGAVKTFDCADAACANGSARAADQVSANWYDKEIAVALRANGLPILAYPVWAEVRMLFCQTASCQ
ncbi:MAG: hypothetical protein U1F41_07380 [Burkholderiales bacterium]